MTSTYDLAICSLYLHYSDRSPRLSEYLCDPAPHNQNAEEILVVMIYHQSLHVACRILALSRRLGNHTHRHSFIFILLIKHHN